jgi:hypothetical protein
MRGSIPRYKKADFLERPEMSRANWPSMYHFNSTFGSTLVRHVDSALELADGIAYNLRLPCSLPSYISRRECISGAPPYRNP